MAAEARLPLGLNVVKEAKAKEMAEEINKDTLDLLSEGLVNIPQASDFTGLSRSTLYLL